MQTKTQLLEAINRAVNAAELLPQWLAISTALRIKDDLGTLPRFAEVLSLCATAAHKFSLGTSRSREDLLRLATLVKQTLQDAKINNSAWFYNPLNRLGSYCAKQVEGYELLHCFSLAASLQRESRFEAIRALLIFQILEGDVEKTKLVLIANGLRKAGPLNQTWGKLIDATPAPETTEALWTAALSKKAAELQTRVAIDAQKHFLQSLEWLSNANQPGRAAPIQNERSLSRTASNNLESEKPKREFQSRVQTRRNRSPDERKPPPAIVFECLADSDDNNEPHEPIQIAAEETPKTLPQEAEVSAGVSALSLKRCGYRLTEVNYGLRWAWDHLNSYDIDLLVSAASADIKEGAERAGPALFVLIMLCTGIDAIDLPSIPIGERLSDTEHFTLDGIWIKPVLMPPEAWKPSAESDAVLAPSTSVLHFPLPPLVREAFVSLVKVSPTAHTIEKLIGSRNLSGVQFVGKWLDAIRNKAGNARLSHGRIARALRVEVNALAQNDVVSHLIAGRDFDVPPIASYYTGTAVSNLTNLYAAACDRILAQRTSAQPSMTSETFAGSLLVPKATELRRFVTHLAEGVERARNTGLAQAHNAFVRYTLWMLLLGTGHRPVQDPFESLEAIDWENGWLIINDKQSTPMKAGRLVPLADLLAKQLSHYLDHLLHLKHHLQPTDPELSARIDTALARSGLRSLPLFFCIDEVSGKWKRISQAFLAYSLHNLGGLPVNLGRHFLATSANEENWSNDLVREMLGHLEFGTAAFSTTSPLSTKGLRNLGLQVDRRLRELGWIPIAPPLSEPRLIAEPATVICPPPQIDLGSVIRLNNQLQRANTCRSKVNAIMRSALNGKQLNQLTQEDVDQTFLAALDGRTAPYSLVSLERYNKLMRRFRFLKDRYSLEIALPRKFSELPLEKAAFAQDALQCIRMHTTLCERFTEIAFRRARSNFKPSQSERFAEVIVSLVLHSFVLDRDLLRSTVEHCLIKLLDSPMGLFAEFAIGTDESHQALRRHRLHPLSAVLVARSINELQELRGRAKAILKDIRSLIQDCMPEASEANDKRFDTPLAALDWLIHQTTPVSRLALPGSVRAYQEGVHQAVSLPREDFVRILHGKPLATPPCPDVDRPVEPSLGTLEEDILSLGDKNANAPSKESPHSRAIKLNKAICASITANIGHRGVGGESQPGKHLRSTRQKDRLEAEALKLLKTHSTAPAIAALLVRWLIHLCRLGVNQNALRASSCAHYYQVLARSLIDLSAELNVAALSADALTEIYAACVASTNPSHQEYRFNRLREFHRFLMRTEGFSPVDWAEIAPEGIDGIPHVDAGFITWDEYVAAFELLLNDPYSDARTQHLQALAWFFMYRFGARRNEAMGLRKKDIIVTGETLVILFRHNDFREIKTDNGIRQVPLIGPLLPQEKAALHRWLGHIDEFAADDQLSAIFSSPDNGRLLMDRNGITERITQALNVVTGSTRMRIHYARHSFATRNEWLMTADSEALEHPWEPAVRRLIGPITPKDARALLTDTPALSKKGLWAAASVIGHGWPGMTARYYSHVTDLLAGAFLEEVWREKRTTIDAPTAAYLAGVPVSEAYAAYGKNVKALTLQDKHARKLAGDRAEKSDTGLQRRVGKKVLDPIIRSQRALTIGMVDQIVSLMHLGRSVEAIEDLMFVPAPLLAELVAAAYKVQATAHYGVPGSAWVVFQQNDDVRFSRSGKRTPAETARLKGVFQRLDALAVQGNESPDIFSAAAAVWTERYLRTRSALVIHSVAELETLLRWAVLAGIPPHLFQIEVGKGGYEASFIESVVRSAGFEGCQCALSEDLPLLMLKDRAERKKRIGLSVVENSEGPLTSTAQLHRCLFALAVYVHMQKTNDGQFSK